MKQRNRVEGEFSRAVSYEAGAQVAVYTLSGFTKPLDYVAPVPVARGSFVNVPLGKREVLGVVWGEGAQDVPPEKLKSILEILPLSPMKPSQLRLIEAFAQYTITPIAQALRLFARVPNLDSSSLTETRVFPVSGFDGELTEKRSVAFDCLLGFEDEGITRAALAQEAGVSPAIVKALLDIGAAEAREIAPKYEQIDLHKAHRKTLTTEQTLAAEKILAAQKPVLLKGVTGAGKTEVYFELIADVLENEQQALILLPEISLTNAFFDRVAARFGVAPMVWHSDTKLSERTRIWHGVASGQAQIVIGARSALFLPYHNLGTIIVDEEHDGSYKQEDGIIYNARDMAVLRGHFEDAKVLLASATPSLESVHNTNIGKYTLVEMHARVGERPIPKLQSIDLREAALSSSEWLSNELIAEIRTTIESGEQALLFLNRRGFAPLTICRACGHQVACRDCDAKMVEHRFHNKLMCHQCGFTMDVPNTCPSCEVEGKMVAIGPGIERVADEVAAKLPQARTVVLSSDIAGGTKGLKARLEAIETGNCDLVIGTQLVAKGHNFPNLTLVGIVDADIGLEGGDLRAMEKSFQLIRQVAGRAGRAEKPGRALVQTYRPDHAILHAILAEDDKEFYETELRARLLAHSPPFSRLVGVIISSPNEKDAHEIAREMLKQSKPLRDLGVEIFGPAPAPMTRIRGRYRIRFLLKANKALKIQDALEKWREMAPKPANARIVLDIDPQSFY